MDGIPERMMDFISEKVDFLTNELSPIIGGYDLYHLVYIGERKGVLDGVVITEPLFHASVLELAFPNPLLHMGILLGLLRCNKNGVCRLEDFCENIDFFIDGWKTSHSKEKDDNKDQVCTYLMKDIHGMYKIGKSIDPKFRHSVLAHSFAKLELIHVIDYDIEKELHEKFKAKRDLGEWFKLNDEDVKYIKSIKPTMKVVQEDIMLTKKSDTYVDQIK